MKAKKWVIALLAAVIAGILLCIVVTVVVDPYFHYHGPVSGLVYELNEERYTNDGISRQFDYNAIITGTSMAENFKASECDKLWEVKTIKTCFAGAGYQEISEYLHRVLERNPDVKIVIQGLDGNMLTKVHDWQRYAEYPTYLYDDIWWNDIFYVLNKSVIYHGVIDNIVLTMQGAEGTSFDEYASFDRELGKEAVICDYEGIPMDERGEQRGMSESEAKNVEETLNQNIISLARKYPNVQFYLFIPPYSIAYFNGCSEQGILNVQFEAYQKAAELLLECENVKFFYFNDEYEMVCDLNNYSDSAHYSSAINSKILNWMKEGKGELTKDNYQQKIEETKEFYMNYDYNVLFEE